MTKQEFADMIQAAREPISGGARRVCLLHWTYGGTGITNFSPEEEPKYIEALRRTGDEFLLIHSKALGGNLSSQKSLHDTFPLRRDLGRFWEHFRIVEEEQKREGAKH